MAMNLVRRFQTGWLVFLLPLIVFFSHGCSTEQSGVAANKDLEKYRRVFIVRPKEDDHDVITAIFSRLKVAGFDASEVDAEGLKKIVAGKAPTQPALVCSFDCVTTWDYDRTWYSFMAINIEFQDLETEKIVFSVSRNNYNFAGSRLPGETELNRLFTKIRDNFFPGQPNPFRDDLKGPHGPTYRRFQTDI